MLYSTSFIYLAVNLMVYLERVIVAIVSVRDSDSLKSEREK